LNHGFDGTDAMRKHYSHLCPLGPIFGLYCLKNIVGGSKAFYHAKQSLKNRLEVTFVIQLVTSCLQANFEIAVHCMALSKTRSYAIIVIVGPLFLKVSTPWHNCQHSKKGEPMEHVNLSATSWSCKFKEWDPSKFILGCNFYNLEDKVGLDRMNINVSKDIGCNEVGLEIESNELGKPKMIILHLRSGMTMLPFSSDSLVLKNC